MLPYVLLSHWVCAAALSGQDEAQNAELPKRRLVTKVIQVCLKLRGPHPGQARDEGRWGGGDGDAGGQV